MSRIGKKPVALSSGVSVDVAPGLVKVKGPKGELQQEIDRDFTVDVTDKDVSVGRPTDQKAHRAKHGLYRALISNMVKGVSDGFSTTLEIEGVGYSAKIEGKNKLVLSIGFNAPVAMPAPEGTTVECPKNTIIVVSGCDKQKVGQYAAEIRAVRPPEPYKGKGIRYKGEYIRRKAGKAIGGKG